MDSNTRQESLKNRDAFTKQQTKLGMPTGIFMAGLLVVFGSYFLFKTFLAPILIGGLYYPLMIQIHKNDSRGLLVWLACVRDKQDCWQAGTVNEIEVLLIEDKE